MERRLGGRTLKKVQESAEGALKGVAEHRPLGIREGVKKRL